MADRRAPGGDWFDAAYFGHIPVSDHKSNYSRVGGYGPGVAGAAGWAEHLVRRLSPGARVLDVGCADGSAVALLRSRGFDAYGVDISSYIIERSGLSIRPYLAVADVRSIRASALVRAAAPFELVASKDLLEHVDEQDLADAIGAMAEIGRAQVHVVNTGEHPHQAFDGDASHLTRRPLSWWQELASRVGGDVTFLAT